MGDGRELAGSVAWVTGGGTGIGRALALECARRGADVAISGRRVDKLEEVAAAIREVGVRALVVPLDVTDEVDSARAVATIVRELGRLDVAVANAGYGASGRFMALTADIWRKQLDVNVVGVVNTAKAAIPELEKTKGRLALVSSVMGMLAMAAQGPYVASKFAVRGIGLVLAQELHGTGVSCTTVYPGFVESEIAQVDATGRFVGDRVDKRPKKLMWSADKAARVMLSAIMKRKREHVFTAHGKVGAFLGRHLPGLVHFAMTRKGTKKKVTAAAKVT
ncbi:MAG: SDR family NAD(P)-dependent oxidoreductase [Deltaproteobacteria bacterium]|nr:SDR family NAD(P)-dependent oxidoreductase [Deltaproteobacteria bacterium]